MANVCKEVDVLLCPFHFCQFWKIQAMALFLGRIRLFRNYLQLS